MLPYLTLILYFQFAEVGHLPCHKVLVLDSGQDANLGEVLFHTGGFVDNAAFDYIEACCRRQPILEGLEYFFGDSFIPCFLLDE